MKLGFAIVPHLMKIRKNGVWNALFAKPKKVDKAIMAPGIAKKSNQQPEPQEKFVQMVRQVEQHVAENFEYVGEDFADEARAMHYGDSEKRDIYGETTLEDAAELIEEGIEVTPLPHSVPSKKQN